MSRVLTLAGREWRGYFLSPVGYIILAIWALMTGVFFISRSFDQGQPASLRAVFELGMWMLLFVCPAISMRAISEERRMGTFELLMTSPISEGGVVLGKFFGAMGFLVVMFLPTVVPIVALELFGQPDYGELACGYLGLLLAGAAYLSSGLLASSLTNSQVVAFLLTMFFWVALAMTARLLPAVLPAPWPNVAFAADPDPRLRDFAIGLIDTSNVVYFVSLTVFFLLATIGSLASRRWR